MNKIRCVKIIFKCEFHIISSLQEIDCTIRIIYGNLKNTSSVYKILFSLIEKFKIPINSANHFYVYILYISDVDVGGYVKVGHHFIYSLPNQLNAQLKSRLISILNCKAFYKCINSHSEVKCQWMQFSYGSCLYSCSCSYWRVILKIRLNQIVLIEWWNRISCINYDLV